MRNIGTNFLVAFGLLCAFVSVSFADSVQSKLSSQSIERVLELPNHTVFVLAVDGIYVNSGDGVNWQRYSLYLGSAKNNEVVADLAGGSADGFFVVTGLEKKQLTKLSPATMPAVIIKKLDGPAAFISEKKGCLGSGNGISLTLDGGQSWSAPQAILPNATRVETLTWISEKEIVVTGGGMVALVPVSDKIAPNLWSVPVGNGGGIYSVHAMGEHADWIFLLNDKTYVLSRTGGKIIATASGENPSEGIFVHQSDLYSFGYLGVFQKTWNGEKFGAPTRLTDSKVAGVVGDDISLVVLAMDGSVSVIGDHGVLKPADLKIDTLKSAMEPSSDDRATVGEDEELARLLSKADPDARKKITKEAESKKEMSPRDKVLWQREQLNKLGVKDDAPPTTQPAIDDGPTDAEITEMMELLGKVDQQTADRISKEMYTRKDLKGRQGILWAIEQLKQNIAKGQGKNVEK